MSEKTTASVIQQYSPEIAYTPENFEAEVAGLGQKVADFLGGNHIDPNRVLFAGYNEYAAKTEGSEHWETGDTPQFYFGDMMSLTPPTSLSEDEEMQGEHWAVNPLNYALSNGTLGIYDREKLGNPTEHDTEFGTYLYELSPDAIGQAQIAALQIRTHDPSDTRP